MPFIESGEQAHAVVAATRLPSAWHSRRRAPPTAAPVWLRADYFARINDNISVMVQIESEKAVANIDAIRRRSRASTGFSSVHRISPRPSSFRRARPSRRRRIARIVLSAKKPRQADRNPRTGGEDARHYLGME